MSRSGRITTRRLAMVVTDHPSRSLLLRIEDLRSRYPLGVVLQWAEDERKRRRASDFAVRGLRN